MSISLTAILDKDPLHWNRDEMTQFNSEFQAAARTYSTNAEAIRAWLVRSRGRPGFGGEALIKDLLTPAEFLELHTLMDLQEQLRPWIERLEQAAKPIFDVMRELDDD